MPILLKVLSSDSHKALCKMKIDKLTLLLDLPNSWREGMTSYVIGMLSDTACLSAYGLARSYSPGCSGYKVSIAGRIPLSTNPLIWSPKSGFVLQIEPKGNKPRPFLRLDINPEALTPKGMNQLQMVLKEAFQMSWPCWSFARVSRLDVAVDLHGIKLTDWAWDLPKRPSRELICREREIRTIYLGAKKKDPLVVYNKAKQDPLLANGTDITRVECRIKNPGTVDGLLSLNNPFAGLKVFATRKLALPTPHREALMSVACIHGWRGVLETFPKEVRKQREKELASNFPAWWDPDAIWKNWSATAKATLGALLWSPGAVPDDAKALAQALHAEKLEKENAGA